MLKFTQGKHQKLMRNGNIMVLYLPVSPCTNEIESCDVKHVLKEIEDIFITWLKKLQYCIMQSLLQPAGLAINALSIKSRINPDMRGRLYFFSLARDVLEAYQMYDNNQ